MTERRRVDIVNFNFFDWRGEALLQGGAERYVLELARLVRQMGAAPRIVQNAFAPFERDVDGIPVVGIPVAPDLDMATMSSGFGALVRDAALVVASPMELAANLRIDAPVIGINHGIHWDYPNNRFDVHDFGIERSKVEAVLACTLCVCVDTTFYNWLRCLDADAASRLRFVPNFVDLDVFHPSGKRFDEPRLEVLFPRRLCRERGFADVVEAFDELLPRHPALALHVCGSGGPDEESAARGLAERHPGQVRLSALALDEMAGAYAASHVVLVPTVFAEGTSLSCIEAMATNNAVVTTPVGGLGNLVIDGHNGVLVAPGAKGIVEAVERLERDRALLERLARSALEVVPAFGKARWVRRWQDVLQEAAPDLFGAGADALPDLYARRPGWAYGFDALREQIATAEAREREVLARHAEVSALHAQASERLMWVEGELNGIKTSTGWALLQVLYRIRFALFPRGSRRDALGRWLMHRARGFLRSSKPRPAPVPAPAASPPAPAVVAGAGGTAPGGVTVATSYAIVCLPILEWSFRFQRPQQLARCFARHGHEVLFARHSFGAALTAAPLEPGITSIELPGTAGANPYRDRLDPAAAGRMADALIAHLGERGIGQFACLVQLPFWAPLALALRERSGCDLVYDCMDLHSGFSSNTADALDDEERLLAASDLVVCTAQPLVDHAAPHARRTALIRNGVDYEHFAAVAARPPAVPGERLTVGYYGAIADWFDSALVAGIARLRPHWRIVLIGSTWSADTAPLEAAPNVELLGEKPYADLPALIADWDCCLIPFRHTPLTTATNPVKVYEMLAAGKPVVSVGLPELRPMAEAGLVALAESAEAFVAAVEAQLAADSPTAVAARRAFAAANTWDARARAIEDEIDAVRPLVSIVIVTFGNLELNKLCLASVLGDTDYPDFEVIVVDNASQDGTPQMLRERAAREPRLKVILNEDNRGFSAANNQGAAVARGRYLCFLNNDTVVHGHWLATLVGHLRRHAHLGLVGPVTNAIGNEAKIPVGYEDLGGMPAWADRHCAEHAGRLTDVSMLAFFCVVVPRRVWQQVGRLDERFGAGMFEDDDYNRRVRAAGYDVKLAWDAFVHHWQRASFKLIGEDEYLRIYRENQANYAAKWQGSAEPGTDPLAGLKRRAAPARGTVVFAPSVGWAIPLAQRPHHIARVLARDGYIVVFDCTNAADPVDTLREVEPGLFLYKGPPSQLAGLPRMTLWTFSYNYDYRDAFPPGTAVIYDWIDDLAVFPYDPRKLAALHARALREATVVLSVARALHDQAVAAREDALYVPNAVEEGRFEREPAPNPALDDAAFRALVEAGRPIAGYYGALAHWFDYALLAAVARRRPDWSFVLIGPDHDGSLARAKLDRVPNIHWLGPKPYGTLPGYLHRFDVAMIPFAINDITLATSPLKLYEYFAAGKPVISTPMPECAAFDVVRIVQDEASFDTALDQARAAGRDAAHVARLQALGKANTWRARAREVMAAVDAATTRVGAGAPAAVAAPPPAPQAVAEPPPPAALAHKPFLRGTCNVCGKPARFFRDHPSLDRESLTCEHCRSTSRYRSIAQGVLRAIAARTGLRADAIALLPRVADVPTLRIYDTQPPFRYEPVAYPVPDLLRKCEWIDLTVSAFRPDRPVGTELAPGVINQNLERLTFADASFDLVITSDVMEHVRLDALAHREIARVLKPGGVYLFTVPHFRDRQQTFVRVLVHDAADAKRDEYVTEPEYHGDANAPDGAGVLSYRSYGLDLDDALRGLGFDVEYAMTPDDAHAIRNAELFYCVKRG